MHDKHLLLLTSATAGRKKMLRDVTLIKDENLLLIQPSLLLV